MKYKKNYYNDFLTNYLFYNVIILLFIIFSTFISSSNPYLSSDLNHIMTTITIPKYLIKT